MHRVDFHAVDARILQELGALGKRVDDFADLRFGHFAGRELIRPAVGRGARAGGDLVEIHERFADDAQHGIVVEHFHHRADGKRATEARRQLHKQLRAGLVEFGHPCLEVVEHFLVLVQPLAAHGIVDRLAARQQQTDVVLGDFHDEARADLVEVIVNFHPAEQIGAAHTGQHDAVFDLAAADFPRGKQGR